MADVHEMQERIQEMQNSDEVKNVFSKLVSGKEGYETVIEKKKEFLLCKKCGNMLEGHENFCPECGFKVEKKKK